MGMDGEEQVVHRGLELKRHHRFGNHLRRQRADDVHAQEFAVLFFSDNFDEALMLADDGSLAVGRKREFIHSNLVSSFPRRPLGEPDRTDLRLAIGAARDAVLPHRRHLPPSHLSHRHDPFHRSGVSQLRQARHQITDGVDSGLVRLHGWPHMDVPPFHPGASFFEPDSFRVRLSPHPDQNFFGGKRSRRRILFRLLSIGDRHAFRGLLHALDQGVRQDFDAPLLEGFLKFGGDLFVLKRHDTGKHFKERHFRAERVKDGSKFDPDGARAHDDQRFRHCRQVQDLLVAENRLPVKFDSGQTARLGARSDENVLGAHLGRLPILLNRDDPRRLDLANPQHGFHFVFAEEVLQTLIVLFDDLIFASAHGLPIERDALALDAKFPGMLEKVVELGIEEQRLGRDAAPIQAGAAKDWFAFDDECLQTPLARADGRHVASGAAADDGQVVLRHVSQKSPPRVAAAQAHTQTRM